MLLERRLSIALWSAAVLLATGPWPAAANLLNSTARQPFQQSPQEIAQDAVDQAAGLAATAAGGASSLVGDSLLVCSCDCCQVAQRLPSEVISAASNTEANYKCIVGSEPTSSCARTCQDKSPRGALDFSTSMGASALDYERFCVQACKAGTPAQGTACAPKDELIVPGPDGFSFQDQAEQAAAAVAAADEEDGEMSVPAWKKELDAKKKKAAEEQLEDTNDSFAVSRYVTFDMRNLVAQRLRSEAGASMAHGAATGERVRLNQHLVDRNGKQLKKVKKALAPVETAIDDSKSKVKESASKAVDDAKRAKKLLGGAKNAVSKILQQVKGLTEEAIKKETVVAAQEEASSFAARMGWGEPDNYRKIVSNKASEAYLKAMATALQRVSDYKAYAKGFAAQARAAQAKAQGLSSSATASEAQGDMLGAISMRHQIKGLLQSAQDLQAEAEKNWKIAEKASDSVKKWQEAAYAASAYAVEQLDLGRSPPKGI